VIITIEHRDGKFPTMNVSLTSKAGAEPFLTIRDCRIVEAKGKRFVSGPAKKLDGGKWFNFTWFSDAFQAAILKEAEKAQPKATQDEAPW
jgi:hypothetical protein